MLVLCPDQRIDLLRIHDWVGWVQAGSKTEPKREQGVAVGAREAMFDELYRANYPRLVAFFGRRGFDPELSRDLAQDTLLRAYQGLDAFEARAKPQTWIQRIAVHLAQNWIRDQRHTLKRAGEETSLDEAETAGQQFADESLWGQRHDSDPERRASERETLERVRHVMADLAPRQRDCLLLWLKGNKYREIAEQLGISTQAVRSILSQAKERVRVLLADEDARIAEEARKRR